MKRYEHGANVYDFDNDVIDFSSNINPLGPSPDIVSVIKKFGENMDEIIKYPDVQYRQLREHLSQKFHCSPNEVIIGNGATELIHLFVRAMGPKTWLIPVPSFLEYERAVRFNGAEISFNYLKREDSFALNYEHLKKQLGEADGLILANPNNPTGLLNNFDSLYDLIKYAAKMGKYVMLDEAFIEFADNSENISMVKHINSLKNLFVIRAATKFYAIPGLRLGYGFGNCDIIERLNIFKEPWTVNALAQSVGMVLYDEPDYINSTRQYVKSQLNFMMKELNDIEDIEAFPSYTNFILCRLKKGDCIDLKNKLIKQGILIRDASNFLGLDSSYFRVAVRSADDNIKLIKELKRIFNS